MHSSMARKLYPSVLLECQIIHYMRIQNESNDTSTDTRKNEEWTKVGIKTPGFYAKHVLWNKPSLKASVDDLNKKFKIVHFILKLAHVDTVKNVLKYIINQHLVKLYY